jgi:hypothetical protein
LYKIDVESSELGCTAHFMFTEAAANSVITNFVSNGATIPEKNGAVST